MALKITLTGYYGSGNLGDDIMLVGFVQHLLRIPGVIVNVFQYWPSISPLQPHQRLNIIVIPNHPVRKIIKAMSILKKSDWLIWGGGTCFTDTSGDGGFKLFLLAKCLGCKIGYIGVGIGRLVKKTRILKTRILLNISEIITFRDSRSVTLARKLTKDRHYSKIYKTEDLSYLMLDKFVPSTGNLSIKEDTLLICVRPLEQYLNNIDLARFWENWTNWLVEEILHYEPRNIIFLPIDDRRDVEISTNIANKIGGMKKINNNNNIRVMNDLSPTEKIGVIAKADYLIAMRLHACLIGTTLGVLTFGVAYCEKVREYFNQVGHPNNASHIKQWIKKPCEVRSKNATRAEVILKSRKLDALKNISLLKTFFKVRLL